MRFIGRREGRLGRALRPDGLGEAETGRRRHHLFVAFNYGGAEISMPQRRYEGGGRGGVLGAPLRARDARADLLIRTSGERRISNFLLWQCAYSEMVFRDELWPDFTRAAFEEALEEYAARARRFGGTLMARARRTGGSDLGARVPRGDPGDRRGDLPGRPGRPGLHDRPDRPRLHLPARAVRDVRPGAPVRLAGFAGLAGMLLAAQYGEQFHVLLASPRPSR